MEACFSIREAARRSGLSAHVIRAWEQRYGAVKPVRTATRRRLFTTADIDRLLLLRSATERGGLSIREAAALADDVLREHLVQHAQHGTNARATGAVAGGATIEQLLDRCKQAVLDLDELALEDHLDRARLELAQTDVLERVIAPLMRYVGDAWHAGALRPAQEHAAVGVVRDVLIGMRRAHRPGTAAPRLIVATPAGQLHEVGALLAAAAAAHDGWRVLYLGTDLPAEELAAAARVTNARAIALSIVHPLGDPRLFEELGRLRRMIDDDVPILLGGRAALSQARGAGPIGVRVVPDLAGLRRALREGLPA